MINDPMCGQFLRMFSFYILFLGDLIPPCGFSTIFILLTHMKLYALNFVFQVMTSLLSSRFIFNYIIDTHLDPIAISNFKCP